MNRKPFLSCVLFGMTLLLCSCAGKGPRILHDFRGSAVPTTITAIGSAVLHVADGRLFVDCPSPGDGVRIEISPQYQCFAFEDVLLANSDPGDMVTLKWIVRDQTGTRFVLLQSDWEHTQSTEHRTTKKDKSGKSVQVVNVLSQKTVSSFRPFRVAFDRRVVNGAEEVQLEFRDPKTNKIKKLFPWQDPEPTQTVALEITTTLANFSIGSVHGDTQHNDSGLEEFPDSEFRILNPDGLTGEEK